VTRRSAAPHVVAAPREAVVVATRNGGKLAELAPMIAAAGFDAISLDAAGVSPSAVEDELECFDTFEENALAKARYFFARAAGRPVLADDSGLAVDALDGAPGVRSKRWSALLAAAAAPAATRAGASAPALSASTDAANNRALLDALARAGERGVHDRRARFVCVATIVWSGGAVSGRGEATGRILDGARGAGGFGYDPLFRSDELGKTFAEATREEKAIVSHRARAVGEVLASWERARRAR